MALLLTATEIHETYVKLHLQQNAGIAVNNMGTLSQTCSSAILLADELPPLASSGLLTALSTTDLTAAALLEAGDHPAA